LLQLENVSSNLFCRFGAKKAKLIDVPTRVEPTKAAAKVNRGNTKKEAGYGKEPVRKVRSAKVEKSTGTKKLGQIKVALENAAHQPKILSERSQEELETVEAESQSDEEFVPLSKTKKRRRGPKKKRKWLLVKGTWLRRQRISRDVDTITILDVEKEERQAAAMKAYEKHGQEKAISVKMEIKQ